MEQAMFKDARFLIVDDELVNVRVLERMLEDWGCPHVRGTTSPREAIALFNEFQPDLVLLDLMMPELDGFEVMEQLKPLIPDDDYVPILVLTADPTTSMRHKALESGATDFLTKPFDMIELSLRISNLVETRFLHNQLRDQNQILEQRVAERTRELTDACEQLHALAASLTVVREEERTQISREVHDVLGQALTGIKMDVAWLDKGLVALAMEPQAPLRRKTQSMLQIIDTTIRSVQRIATQLRPALLDDFGLEAAIEWQLQDWEERTNIRCDFVSSLSDEAISPEQSTAVFRILQETLTNIARHAAATRISILLEENAGYLILEVQDNGRGINATEIRVVQSLGLLGMRERARLVGGEVTINGSAGIGTTVTVRVPLHQEQPQKRNP